MSTRLPLAALAVSACLVVAGCGDSNDPQQAADSAAPSGATTSGPSSTTTSTGPAPAASSPPASSQTPAGQEAVPVFFVGTTTQGQRLFREFHSVEAASGLDHALALLTSGQPDDPDYTSLVPSQGAVTEQGFDETIELAVPASWAQRPNGMSDAQAALAVQQIVYTAQGVQQRRVPVVFYAAGQADPLPDVLGVTQPAGGFTATAPLDVLALVNVTTPEQGQAVSGSFTASGVASSFEGSVPWEVLDSAGEKVLDGAAQSTSSYTKLTPWKADIDVSSLAPGDYTFVAMTDDPSGGEGPGPMKDTKAFTVS